MYSVDNISVHPYWLNEYIILEQRDSCQLCIETEPELCRVAVVLDFYLLSKWFSIYISVYLLLITC